MLELDTRLKSATNAARIFNGTFTSQQGLARVEHQIETAHNELDAFAVMCSKIKLSPALLQEFEELKHMSLDLDPKNLGVFQSRFAALRAQTKAAGKDSRLFGDELKNAFSKFGTWISATTIFYGIVRGMRSMIDHVCELIPHWSS